MTEVMVHITLDPWIWKDSIERDKILKKVSEVSGITKINQKRLDRYGILSGMIDRSFLDEIRQVPGVQNVQVDKVRSLKRVP